MRPENKELRDGHIVEGKKKQEFPKISDQDFYSARGLKRENTVFAV